MWTRFSASHWKVTHHTNWVTSTVRARSAYDTSHSYFPSNPLRLLCEWDRCRSKQSSKQTHEHINLQHFPLKIKIRMLDRAAIRVHEKHFATLTPSELCTALCGTLNNTHFLSFLALSSASRKCSRSVGCIIRFTLIIIIFTKKIFRSCLLCMERRREQEEKKLSDQLTKKLQFLHLKLNKVVFEY